MQQLSLFQKAREFPKRSVSISAYTGESHILKGLLLVLALCILGYLYFVGISILNVIANREAAAQSNSLQTAVSSLEQEYFKLSKSVTPERGESLGLSATKNQAYVRRALNVASNVRASDL